MIELLEILELLASGASFKYVISLLGITLGVVLIFAGAPNILVVVCGIILFVGCLVLLVFQIRGDVLDVKKDLKKTDKKL